jgi:hypothetical protein
VDNEVGEQVGRATVEERVRTGAPDLRDRPIQLDPEVVGGGRPSELVAVLLEEAVRLVDARVRRQRQTDLPDQRRLAHAMGTGERDAHHWSMAPG